MSIGENLKRLRERSGITQTELAEQIGVTGPMICQIERGTKTMSLPLSKQIAERLGCTVEDLLAERAGE